MGQIEAAIYSFELWMRVRAVDTKQDTEKLSARYPHAIIVVKAARGEKFLVRAKRVSFCLILRLLSDGVLGTIFGTWKKRGMRGEEREVKMDGVK